MAKLKEAVEFIHDRINYPYFSKKDLERTVGKRLNKGTPSASTIKSELLDGIYFNNKTMEHYTKKLAQKKFLNQIFKQSVILAQQVKIQVARKKILTQLPMNQLIWQSTVSSFWQRMRMKIVKKLMD